MKKGSFIEFFDGSEVARRYEDRKEEIEKGGLLKMFDEASFIKNRPVWEKDLFRKINNFLLNEIRKGVVVNFLLTYTRYSFNNLMFCKMKSTSEALKIYLKLHYSEVKDPQRWVRDYEKVSRQVWMEITIREKDLVEETILLDNVFDLMKQAFNQVIRHPKLSKIPVEKPVKTLPNFVTTTKFKLDLEIGTNGFVMLGLRVHKSQLPRLLEKLIE